MGTTVRVIVITTITTPGITQLRKLLKRLLPTISHPPSPPDKMTLVLESRDQR